MTTQRLYYADSYTTTFDAQVTEKVTYADAPAVILDRTYFYPTSGGQPHDLGTLNDHPVTDVVIRESDGAVLHVLAADLVGGRVRGQVDWARRFDHMQHHTGQHILSQAFIELAKAETVGFHLSPDNVTIDLDKPGIKPATIQAAEARANQIVTENRSVRAWFPTDDELTTLKLRKVPDVDGKFRVVEINGFDVNACGGTHISRTGEIGLIKVLRVEKRGDGVRIEFRCGGRALADYQQKHALLSQLAADLTTGHTEIPAVLNKLREENKALQRELRALKNVLLEHEAAQLWQNGVQIGALRLVMQLFDQRDAADVRQLVQNLVQRPATIALCGAAGEKAQLIFGRSDDLPHDMVLALKQGLAVWQVDRGGGRPSFAQGGGCSASAAEVERALQAAAAVLDLPTHKG
jgi:alanyl-tRNA synthetase